MFLCTVLCLPLLFLKIQWENCMILSNTRKRMNVLLFVCEDDFNVPLIGYT